MEENQFELADALAEAQRNAGIAIARRQMVAQSDPNFDGEHCIDCDEKIAPQRLLLKRMRCTACESLVERRNKTLGI